MKPLEAIKQDLKTRVNQLMEEHFAQIEGFETRLIEKDQKLNMLSASLSQITEEYEILKASNAENTAEISRLQAELQKVKVRELGDQELIILYQPQDVFKYPRDIIRWYFNELDFKRLSLTDLYDSLKGLIELVDCEMIDELLFYISEDRLTTLKETDLIGLLSLLESYLQAQFKKGIYSSAGVFYFLKRIYNLRWTPLLKDFVETNRPYLEEIVYKIDDSVFDFEEPLTLLRIYFDLKLHEVAETWLKEIFCSVVLEKDLESKDAIELLYLSLVYELEEKALIFIPKIQKMLQDSAIPEFQAFSAYNETYVLRSEPEKTLLKLSTLKQEANLLSAPLKVKGFEEMVNRLKRLQEEKLMQEALIRLQTKPSFSSEKESLPKSGSSLKKFQSVFEIKNNQTNCPYDNSTPLKTIKAMLAKYTDARKKVLSQYIEVQLLHCPTCDKAFFTRSLENRLITLVSLKHLDIIPYVPEINNSNSYKESGAGPFIPIANPKEPISTQSTTLTNDHYGEKWQEESPLKKLGYNTNLTRQERWEVLIHRAVPKLGYQRVADYLNWFIEDKRKIKQKDFSRAISIWEDDLKRLYEYKANEILKKG